MNEGQIDLKTVEPRQCIAKTMKVAAIVPAHNEARRIRPVLEALIAAPEVDEVVMISDGSTDDTCAVAASVPGVTALELKRNKGKGGAMLHAAQSTDADVLIFFDADLIGLNQKHIHDLLEPVLSGEATMALGIFQGGRWATDIAQRWSPGITGQRALLREVFLQIPDVEHVGYGVELAITYYVRYNDLVSKYVPLRGITATMKEEKLGLIRGSWARTVMYWEMLRFRVSYEFRGRPPKKRKKK